MPPLTATEWNAFFSRHPEGHLLQSSLWGQFKDQFGWSPAWFQEGEAGAQVLFRRLPLGFSVAYLPKGPVGPGWEKLWPTLDRACRQHHAIFLRVEPDAWEPDGQQVAAQMTGFHAANPVQPRRTILVDLSGSEEDWLARMKQKTRYNIRLAERKGVVVRSSNDLDEFHRLMQVTGQRDGFGVHNHAYYKQAYALFAPRGQCQLLAAEFEGTVLAMLMVFACGQRSWYFYGASSDAERNRMPTYLLQWEAMRWAASCGCKEYDLWGVPDAEENDLENEFSGRADGLWGVYRFKRGFGGKIVRSVGAWEKVYQPLLYRVYNAYMARRSGEGDGR